MAKVTQLKWATGNRNKNFGTLHIKKFSIFNEDDMEAYAKLREADGDASSGIKIGYIREYSRKTTTTEGDGSERIVTTTEEIILVVEYWEKSPKRTKGDSDEEVERAKYF